MKTAHAGVFGQYSRTSEFLRLIRIILTICLMAGLLLTSMQPAYASVVIHVDSDEDNTLLDTHCTLREAISSANTDPSDDCASGPSGTADQIVFDGNYTITLSSALPTITEPLTITGNGAANTIIRANAAVDTAAYRVITVDAVDVTLSGLTIRNGKCAGACALSGDEHVGGNIFNNGGVMILDGVTVSDGRAAAAEGVISIGGSLTIRNGSVITGNASPSNGGGVYAATTTLLVDASTISNNSAGSTSGGGIFVFNNATATIRNGSVISNNSGIAIVDVSDSSVTVSGSTLSDNAQGAVHLGSASSLTMTGSKLLRNTRAGAGAIYADNSASTLTITGSCLVGNEPAAIITQIGATQIATGNWWGSPSGPGPVGPSTYGDNVDGDIDFDGFLTSPILGCGYNPAPATGFSPGSLSFGGQPVGMTSAAKTVTLTNTSSMALVITTLTASPDYALSGDTCGGQTLSSWESCTFGVTFTPSAGGARPGNVHVDSDAWNSLTNVSLSGTGLTLLAPPSFKAPKMGAVYKPPKLSWKGPKGVLGYHVEVDDDSDFSSPERTADLFNSPYPVSSLPFGVYYWHVATQGLFSQGGYSPAFTFEMTLNKSPKKNAILKNGVVAFKWQAVKNATYVLRITDETAHTVYFQSPSPLAKPSYKVDKNAPIPTGDYSWQVSADGGGTWTPPWNFHVN